MGESIRIFPSLKSEDQLFSCDRFTYLKNQKERYALISSAVWKIGILLVVILCSNFALLQTAVLSMVGVIFFCSPEIPSLQNSAVK